MSGHFPRIIVGIDLGPTNTAVTSGSRIALNRARWLAERFESQICLIHSTPADEYWDAGAGSFVLGNDGIDAGGKELLASLLQELQKAGIDARLERTSDKAWLAIIQEALRWKADLIVAGKRTESFDDGRRIGSIAKKLLRNAPCAVWLENPGHEAAPRVVVAATDLSEVGQRALAIAAALSSELGADLHVVHAYNLPLDVQMEGIESQERYDRQSRDHAGQQIRAELAGSPIAEGAQLHLGLNSPSHAILQVAKQSGADLVVMGTVSRGGIPGFLVGNTAERLFDLLDCGLLTVKPSDVVCPVVQESS